MLDRDAIKFIQEQAIRPADRLVWCDDTNYYLTFNSDGEATPIRPFIPIATKALKLSTLTGIVDYIKSGLEKSNDKLYLQIKDEQNVFLLGTLLQDGNRECLITSYSNKF